MGSVDKDVKGIMEYIHVKTELDVLKEHLDGLKAEEKNLDSTAAKIIWLKKANFIGNKVHEIGIKVLNTQIKYLQECLDASEKTNKALLANIESLKERLDTYENEIYEDPSWDE